MNSTTTETTNGTPNETRTRTDATTDAVQVHNRKAQAVWNSPAGRYDEVSRSIADAIEHAVARVCPRPGEHILDLATGTGWASRVLAQRYAGLDIVGSDIAEQMLAYARASAATLGLAIDYRHADAERLPFADGSFDAVISTFGVMFATKPEAAAAELARVVRKGGRVVLSTWKWDDNVHRMFGVMKPFLPTPPQPAPPSPFEWGKRERLLELLGQNFDVSIEEGTNVFNYASGEEAFDFWVTNYGPARTLAGNLDEARREEWKRGMVAFHESFPSVLGYRQPRQYLITRAVRR